MVRRKKKITAQETTTGHAMSYTSPIHSRSSTAAFVRATTHSSNERDFCFFFFFLFFFCKSMHRCTQHQMLNWQITANLSFISPIHLFTWSKIDILGYKMI
uniref:Uncharacterized protein n=1 Tax=Oryza brachyantha TaxID=4533 RepID=J3M9R2_ORYBR